MRYFSDCLRESESVEGRILRLPNRREEDVLQSHAMTTKVSNKATRRSTARSTEGRSVNFFLSLSSSNSNRTDFVYTHLSFKLLIDLLNIRKGGLRLGWRRSNCNCVHKGDRTDLSGANSRNKAKKSLSSLKWNPVFLNNLARAFRLYSAPFKRNGSSSAQLPRLWRTAAIVSRDIKRLCDISQL